MALLQSTLTDQYYTLFRDLVLERSGLCFPEERRAMLSRGVSEAMRRCASVMDTAEYYELLRASASNSQPWKKLVAELTIGETYFFRNKGHFDALSKRILPELIAQRRHLNRNIRIWCAGCATGEEPYSVAMLLNELIPDARSWNILILATDIDEGSLQKAREGVYSPWSFRGVEQRIQDTYFTEDGRGGYWLDDSVKRMVNFSYLNLVQDHYPSLSSNTHGMDLILCRNVTIYFPAEVTQRVISGFRQCLVEGGWYIPGASEPNLINYNEFEHCSFPGAVMYRKPQAEIATPSRDTCAPVGPVRKVSLPMRESTSAGRPGARSELTPFTRSRRTTMRSSTGGHQAQVGQRETPRARVSTVSRNPKAPSRSRETLARDPYDEARRCIKRGDMNGALAKLYEKLDRDPNHVPTYVAMGRIYANKGSFEEAQVWCERAIEKDKLNPECYFTLSMVYQGHGLPNRATDALKKALYLEPTFVLAHYALANLYLQQGEGTAAAKSFRNARRLLDNQPHDALVPEGDGMVVGRLLQLIDVAMVGLGES